MSKLNADENVKNTDYSHRHDEEHEAAYLEGVFEELRFHLKKQIIESESASHRWNFPGVDMLPVIESIPKGVKSNFQQESIIDYAFTLPAFMSLTASCASD